MNEIKRYTTTVIEDGEDLILPIPDEILEQIDAKEGDMLSFDIFDGYVVLKKIDNVAEVKARLTDENSDTE
jgi:bifunctional DNA-binding transcriptional regulator/antitoxin component of YhaV-PrlF toxin-antitoxin module